MSISAQNISAIFKDIAAGRSRKPFIVFRNNRLTYRDLAAHIGKLSSWFRSNGIVAGDRIVVASSDELLACTLYCACLANGLTVILLDPEAGSARAQAIVGRCAPRWMFMDHTLAESWGISAAKECGLTFLQSSDGGKGASGESYPACCAHLSETEPPAVIDPESDAYILFTSGTTAAPKGVRISYRALFAHLATLSRVYRMDDKTRILNNLYLSHADGIIQGPLLALFNQATHFRPPSFTIQTIEDLFDVVFQEEITHWVMVPTMLALVYRMKHNNPERLDHGHFRYVISCADRLDPLLWQRFEETFGARIINGYGLTETVTGGLFAGPDDATHIVGTVGAPVDCEAAIVDERGTRKNVNETGELWLKGPMVMSGYLDAPDATSEVLHEGWLKTGDLAFRGDDGCYRIVGRKKSVIISGGVNVSPEEVTEVLRRFDGIEDAFTFGVEDAIWGERVVSAVTPRNGMRIKESDIIAFCRTHLEERKVPSAIHVVEELPRGSSGKVVLRDLRERLVRGGGERGDAGSLLEGFLEIVAATFQIPPGEISLDMRAADIGAWDSLAHLELVAALERRFQFEFTPMEVMNARSLRDLFRTTEMKQRP